MLPKPTKTRERKVDPLLAATDGKNQTQEQYEDSQQLTQQHWQEWIQFDSSLDEELERLLWNPQLEPKDQEKVIDLILPIEDIRTALGRPGMINNQKEFYEHINSINKCLHRVYLFTLKCENKKKRGRSGEAKNPPRSQRPVRTALINGQTPTGLPKPEGILVKKNASTHGAVSSQTNQYNGKTLNTRRKVHLALPATDGKNQAQEKLEDSQLLIQPYWEEWIRFDLDLGVKLKRLCRSPFDSADRKILMGLIEHIDELRAALCRPEIGNNPEKYRQHINSLDGYLKEVEELTVRSGDKHRKKVSATKQLAIQDILERHSPEGHSAAPTKTPVGTGPVAEQTLATPLKSTETLVKKNANNRGGVSRQPNQHNGQTLNTQRQIRFVLPATNGKNQTQEKLEDSQQLIQAYREEWTRFDLDLLVELDRLIWNSQLEPDDLGKLIDLIEPIEDIRILLGRSGMNNDPEEFHKHTERLNEHLVGVYRFTSECENKKQREHLGEAQNSFRSDTALTQKTKAMDSDSDESGYTSDKSIYTDDYATKMESLSDNKNNSIPPMDMHLHTIQA